MPDRLYLLFEVDWVAGVWLKQSMQTTAETAFSSDVAVTRGRDGGEEDTDADEEEAEEEEEKPWFEPAAAGREAGGAETGTEGVLLIIRTPGAAG